LAISRADFKLYICIRGVCPKQKQWNNPTQGASGKWFCTRSRTSGLLLPYPTSREGNMPSRSFFGKHLCWDLNQDTASQLLDAPHSQLIQERLNPRTLFMKFKPL
jgi:hypothetical protein